MSEAKLSIKNQLYLEATTYLIAALISLVKSLELFSERTNDFLGIVFLIVLAIALVYETKEKEKTDECAKKILGKLDGICIRVLSLIVLAIIIFIDIPANISNEFILELFKNILWLIVTAIAILKAILFSYYDRKGI
ncbi:hypothetical protein GNF80_10785 [Clostridium perfringens]|nr:hypothetical protein [Clostridium perfringens]